MRGSRPILGLLAACLVAAPAGARQAAGSLAGIVVTMDASAKPVRRAIVTLSGDVRPNRSVITDDEGRFSFADLPAGRFGLAASKAAFIATAYGAKKPGRPGTMITLAAGQRLVDLRLQLPHGAAISGTVHGPDGTPAADVPVSVLPVDTLTAGGALLPSESNVMSDDRGAYRAYALAPGEYIVVASARLPGSGDMDAMSSATIDARIRSLQAGTRPGPSSAGTATSGAGASAAAATSASPEPPVGYAPMFFPGTPVAAEAGRVSVGIGEDRTGIDITLQPVRTASVEGAVANLGALPPSSLQMDLASQGPPLPLVSALGSTPLLSIRPGVDGHFKFTGVTPGRYTLSARAMPPPSRGTGPALTSAAASTVLWATQDVTVAGGDVTGLTLSLQPGRRLTGTVVFDATTATPPSTLSGLNGLRIALAPPRGSLSAAAAVGLSPVSSLSPSATVQADGTFEMGGILPNAYVMTIGTPASGWWARSAMAGGRDLLDGPFDLANDLDGVRVTFSDRHTRLNGTLQTPAGQPATEFYVIVLPADRALRTSVRRVRSTRPASDGTFGATDLPPGNYLVVALTDVEPDEWTRPAFLDQIAPAGVALTLGEGETKALTLRIAGTP